MAIFSLYCKKSPLVPALGAGAKPRRVTEHLPAGAARSPPFRGRTRIPGAPPRPAAAPLRRGHRGTQGRLLRPGTPVRPAGCRGAESALGVPAACGARRRYSPGGSAAALARRGPERRGRERAGGGARGGARALPGGGGRGAPGHGGGEGSGTLRSGRVGAATARPRRCGASRPCPPPHSSPARPAASPGPPSRPGPAGPCAPGGAGCGGAERGTAGSPGERRLPAGQRRAPRSSHLRTAGWQPEPGRDMREAAAGRSCSLERRRWRLREFRTAAEVAGVVLWLQCEDGDVTARCSLAPERNGRSLPSPRYECHHVLEPQPRKPCDLNDGDCFLAVSDVTHRHLEKEPRVNYNLRLVLSSVRLFYLVTFSKLFLVRLLFLFGKIPSVLRFSSVMFA